MGHPGALGQPSEASGWLVPAIYPPVGRVSEPLCTDRLPLEFGAIERRFYFGGEGIPLRHVLCAKAGPPTAANRIPISMRRRCTGRAGGKIS